MSQSATPNPSDILFLSPTVISGDEQSHPFVADVLVSSGLITEIFPPGSIKGSHARRIEASGHYLSPGFIDMHAHSDLYLLTHPDHEPKISQGCTTEVVGQDGISYAPVRKTEEMRAIRDQITAWNGNPSDEECAGHLKGIGMFEWATIREYLDCLERNRTATNVAVLVPQGNLRLLTCGPSKGVATREHIEDQMKLLREGMNDGAVGMSSGLTYVPGMYASNSELGILCQTLANDYPGAYYAPHHRSYGAGAIESYLEMLDLGRTTGCPVHLTHATLNFPHNKGRAPEMLSMIDSARSEGVDVSIDTYPYLPGCTTLASLLPSWASSGGTDAIMGRLSDETEREKIRVAIEVTGCDGGHGIPTNWEQIQIGSCSHPDNLLFPDQRVAEVARSLSIPPIEVFFDILRKERLATSCIMHIGNEENVQAIMQHETHTAGSDAILHGISTHPRAYGTFPKFLGHYARNLQLATIPDMISHMTSRPAKRLGIYPHRGLIAPGSAADLVLFDPETIQDMATFEQPKLRSKGIRFVLVNGEVALDEGKMTGMRAGRTLRRRKDGKVTTAGE